MPEPQWKQELSRDLVLRGFLAETEEERMAVVMPHIDAAYQRGLMAGRSQAGYPTRRKKKESDPCTAAAEGRTPALSTDEP
jgi:hypothetical protein